MNAAIGQRLLGRDPVEGELPQTLEDTGNTGAAGCLIAFHRHRDGLVSGDIGVLCAFGAGYTIGGQILRCV